MVDERLSEKQLDKILDDAFEFSQQNQNATGMRRALEVQRLMRDHCYLYGFLHSCNNVMNVSMDTMDYGLRLQTSVELLAYLEDENLARQFESDFSDSVYQQSRFELAPIAYASLLHSVGIKDGFNSVDLRTCVADGHALCKRFGKSEFVDYFSGFLIDIDLAAGNLDQALSASLELLLKPAPHTDGYFHSRSLFAQMAAKICMLQGRRRLSFEYAVGANALYQQVTDPQSEQVLGSLCRLIQSKLSLGLNCDEHLVQLEEISLKAQGDVSHANLQRDTTLAIAAAVGLQFGKAESILAKWDSRLRPPKCTGEWLEVRLLQVAIKQMQNDPDQAVIMAMELEEVATETKEMITLHRLAFLLEYPEAASPFACVAPWQDEESAEEDSGLLEQRFAKRPSDSQGGTPGVLDGSMTGQAGDASEVQPTTPLGSILRQLAIDLDETADATEQSNRKGLLVKIFEYDSGNVKDFRDAGQLISIVTNFRLDGASESIWKWAKALADGFEDNGFVLSKLAYLGGQLLAETEEVDEPGEDFRAIEAVGGEPITAVVIERLLQRSLELDGQRPGNQWRAGEYYLDTEEYQKAEPYLAKAFRACSSDARFGLSLSLIYSQTDRPNEALEVLDACIREGCTSKSVVYTAAEKSIDLELWQRAETYLNRYFEENSDPNLWAIFNAAIASLELGKLDVAQGYIQRTLDSDIPAPWHVLSLQTCLAACLQVSEDHFSTSMRTFLDSPMQQTPVLSAGVVEDCFQRMWRICYPALLRHPNLEKEFLSRCLTAGCMPPEYFDQLREKRPEEEGLTLFRMLVHQPLDSKWKKHYCCRSDQADWTEYYAEWAIASNDQSQAVEEVLKWQSKCYNKDCRVIEVHADPGYHERPGLLYQGLRFSDVSSQ